MDLGEKIRRLRGKLSQAEFGKQFGVSAQTVSQWETGTTEPSQQNRLLIAKKYGVNLASLFESGSKLVGSYDPDADDHTGLHGLIDEKPREGLAAVREYDLRGGASYGGGYVVNGHVLDDEGRPQATEVAKAEWLFPDSWLRGEMRLSGRSTDLIAIDGPSMLPDLAPGDRVLVDRSNTDPKQDAIFAIRDGDSVIVKHVQLLRNSEPPRIICRSSNPKYEPFELILDGEHVSIIGRVAGRISRL